LTPVKTHTPKAELFSQRIKQSLRIKRLLRNLGECRKDIKLERRFRLFDRGHLQDIADPPRKPLHKVTGREASSYFKEHPIFQLVTFYNYINHMDTNLEQT
jgi:hypothetical protein